MDPITAALTGLAINFASEIIISGFKSFQNTGIEKDLKSAYYEALKKWTYNSQIKHAHEHLSRPKLELLLDSLKGKTCDVDIETNCFIEIFKNEICDKKYQSLYQHVNLELQKQQIDLLYEIRNNQNRQIGPVPELQLFTKPKNYIDRTVSGYSNSTSLVEIIKNEHAVALLGEGGLGKTTELNYVASILSNEGWYCGLVRLINYASSLEKLIESQFEDWQNIPASSSVLVLLDGLDEVSSSIISTAENEIIGLTRTHKNVHFLISYRNSYSLFLSLNNEKGESKEVVRVTLDPISEEFVTKYIQENAITPTIVTEQFQKQNLIEICKNPFYLINYIEIINSTGKVPDNKSDFFEKIFSNRIYSEIKKGSQIKIDVGKREGTLRKKLGELALIMQLAGKYQIENCDIQEIIDDPDLLETSRRIVLYETGITDLENWRFEHNNFQEYLAAKKLSKCSWEHMQQILFLPNKKLKPKWYNAISFLINQLDQNSEQHQQLVEWLIENDRVAFVKLEVVHLDQAIRNQVFYSIYNYYKEKEIVFYAEFSAQDIAKFCDLENNQELIDFLLSELKPEMNIQNLYNVVELFEAIKPNDQKDINRIANALTIYLKSEKYNEYHINDEILTIFTQWKWGDEKILKETIDSESLIKGGLVRSSLIQYQLEMNSPFISADFILKCLDIRKRDQIQTSDIFTIKEAIYSLQVAEIIALLKSFIQEKVKGNVYLDDYDFLELLKSIEEHISSLYQKTNDEAIVKLVKQFIELALEDMNHEAAKILKTFFIKSKTILPEFLLTFSSEKMKNKDSQRNEFTVAGFLADESCVDWVITEYLKEKITDEEIWNLSFSMFYFSSNSEIGRLLLNRINEITNNKFLAQPNKFDVAQKKSNEMFAQAILNQELYIRYVEKAFNYLGKDEITKEEFWIIFSRQNTNEDAELTTCRECLRDYLIEGGLIKKDEVISLLNNADHWLGLQLNEHLKLSGRDSIQEENHQWILRWCRETESNIDLKSTNIENGDQYQTRIVYYFIRFCLNINYKPSDKSILLDMVSCLATRLRSSRKNKLNGRNITIYEYLLEYLTKGEINERVLENIEKGIDVENVLDEHIRIIKKESLKSAVNHLPSYILDSRWNMGTRLYILSTYFQFKGNADAVKLLLDELNFDDPYDYYVWNIVDEFSQQNKQLTISKLLPLVHVDQIHQYKLALGLIKCSRKEGLLLFKEILINDESINETYEMKTGLVEKYVKDGNFSTKVVIPFLVDIILMYLKKEKEKEEFMFFPVQCFNLLNHFIKEDMTRWTGVESIIKAALYQSKGTVNYVSIFHHFQKLRLDLNVQMDSECEIDEAVRRLNSILGV